MNYYLAFSYIIKGFFNRLDLKAAQNSIKFRGAKRIQCIECRRATKPPP